MNVANALAAAGAAFAAGTPLHDIRQGLRTFNTSYYQSPGRLNRVELHGTEIFVDYCHNPPGMERLGEFVEGYVAHRQAAVDTRISRIGMIAAAGDRRDQDISEQTEILGSSFDDVILYQDACQRGRADGEVLALLRQGVDAGGLAGVGAADKGDLGYLDGGQLVQLRGGGQKACGVHPSHGHLGVGQGAGRGCLWRG